MTSPKPKKPGRILQPATSGKSVAVEPSVVGALDDDEEARLMELVDALAVLAADLWHAGKLDPYALPEHPPDEND